MPKLARDPAKRFRVPGEVLLLSSTCQLACLVSVRFLSALALALLLLSAPSHSQAEYENVRRRRVETKDK